MGPNYYSRGGLRAASVLALLINVTMYAFAYHAAKDVVQHMNKAHPVSHTTQHLIASFYPHVVGPVLVGVLADTVGPRAALVASHVGSLMVYVTCAVLTLEPAAILPQPWLLPVLLRLGSALQHTMLASQMVVAVNTWHRPVTCTLLLLLVNAAYQCGVLLSTTLPSLLLPLANVDVTVVSAAVTAASALIVMMVRMHPARDNDAGILVPRNSFIRVSLMMAIPALLTASVLRFGRVLLVREDPSLELLSPIEKIAIIAGFGLFILVTQSPVALAVISPILPVAACVLQMHSPRLVEAFAEEFALASRALTLLLYIVPALMISISSPVGMKGRMLGLSSALAALLLEHGDVLRDMVRHEVLHHGGRVLSFPIHTPAEVHLASISVVFLAAAFLMPMFILRQQPRVVVTGETKQRGGPSKQKKP